MKKPNILFIMTDQQRWDAMGCSGGWVQTPNLDRIADEGLRFTNCVTNAPLCIPARVCLATGLYPHNTGIWDNIPYNMPATTPTWMQAIRAAGYRTSLFGKTHLHKGRDLRDGIDLVHAYGLDDVDEITGPRGSMRVRSNMTDRWDHLGLWKAYNEDYRERFSQKPHLVRPSALPLEHYADVYVGQQAKAYLSAYDRPEPWFCWVSFGGPHEPWDAPEPYASMYEPRNMPAPVPRPAKQPGRPQGLLDAKMDHPSTLTPNDVAALRANYAGNVTLIDDQIGSLLETIDARGELDQTVIAFVSDHGEMNGDYGLLYKGHFLNGAVRVPLLLRTPDTAASPLAGTVSDCPVEWFDVGPTLVDLADGELEHVHFAKSLRPLLYDPQHEHRSYAISELLGEIMYLDRKWKMSLNDQGIPYLLFDLENDVQETNNLAGRRDVVDLETELRLKILEHLVQTQIQLESSR